MLRKLFILYLVLVGFFGWGYAAVKYQVFPGNLMVWAESSIRNLWQDSDKKQIESATVVLEEPTQTISLENLIASYHTERNSHFADFQYEKLKPRNRNPLFLSSAQQQPGLRLLYGAFDFGETSDGADNTSVGQLPDKVTTAIHGAILLDQDSNPVHHWVLDESTFREKAEENSLSGYQPPESRWPHGIEVFSDGSIILSDNNRGVGLTKLDWCSEVQWFAPGPFNDVVQESFNEKDFWSIRNDVIVNLDYESGQEIREITINDIHLANPGVAVLTPRRSLRVSKWYHDPIHINDVEPLPEFLSPYFPEFNTGDLLLSLRSLNLILVLDSESLKIKWWRTGVSLRQYDVDWEVDGTISIYDNNRRENGAKSDENLSAGNQRYLRILKIDPDSMEVNEIYYGATDKVYSAEHGKHQWLPNGNLLFSSPSQGRFVEMTPNGKIAFEFVNQFDTGKVLKVSEVKWLPLDFFDLDLALKNCGEKL